VSDGNGRVTAWLFAGGLVSASVARALNEDGVSTVGWDDVSVTARTGDIETLSHALARVDPVTAHPALPNDLATALKFGLCLPPRVAEEVTIARTSSAKDIADAFSAGIVGQSATERSMEAISGRWRAFIATVKTREVMPQTIVLAQGALPPGSAADLPHIDRQHMHAATRRRPCTSRLSLRGSGGPAPGRQHQLAPSIRHPGDH
jgi:hypothetical protein